MRDSLGLFGAALVCLATAAHAADAKGYAVIPLKNVGNAFLVDVQVNDIPMQLIIDTGAPMTVLVGDKATKAGLAWGHARNACEIRTLRCGAATLHGVGAYVAVFHGENAGTAECEVTARPRQGWGSRLGYSASLGRRPRYCRDAALSPDRSEGHE